MTGTAQFLRLVDPYVPDDFINEHWNRRPSRGPHRTLSAAQSWRVHLLADAAVLLRNHALLHVPIQEQQHLLHGLAPRQGVSDLGMETLPEPGGS